MSVLEFDSEGHWVNPSAPKECDFFRVGVKNGFMPVEDPLTALPERYEAVDKLIRSMPVELKDGTPGLLGLNEFRKTVQTSLPNLLHVVEQETDSRLIHALYRDYCIMASAYCLEPCDLEFKRTSAEGGNGTYGLAEPVLVAQIAQPLDCIAKKLRAFPWMEYLACYGAGNAQLKDPSKGYDDIDNIQSVRLIAGNKDEEGFMLVHVIMEALTGPMIAAGTNLLEAVAKKNHAEAQAELVKLHTITHEINRRRETMWEYSKPNQYLKLRTWIFGINNTGLFANNKLHYEGCEDPDRSYRGETGAQSTIIPYLDTVLGVNTAYPHNDLTKYLLELRPYRPYHHRSFLQATENVAAELKVLSFAHEDPNTMVLWLQCLNEIRAFRQGHWNFTKSYIISNSSYPIATGGTPITTWLPNQLGATMELMQNIINEVKEQIGQLTSEHKAIFDEISEKHESLIDYLKKEVGQLRTKYNQ